MTKSKETQFTAEVRNRVNAHRGWSLREFFIHAGLPTSALYRWETGCIPTPEKMGMVRRALTDMERGRYNTKICANPRKNKEMEDGN